MKALSVRQPWAWLLVNGYKDIENRGWKTHYQGPLLIHAGKAWRGKYSPRTPCLFQKELNDIGMGDIRLPEPEALRRGGIVGVIEMVGCVTRSSSPWFKGPYGFVLKGARPLAFHPYQGRQGLFWVDFPE